MHSKNYSRLAWLATLSISLTQVAVAQETPADVAPAPPSATYLLKADTEVPMRLLAPVASNTHKRGDRFALEVTQPVTVDGAIVIPAGAQGEGEVVHAAKSKFGGRAGELILASRFLRVGDQTVKLRSFSAGNGEDRVNLAMGLSLALVGVGFFVNGKEIELPADTNVFAKVATDHLLPATLATGPAPMETPTLPEETATETNDNEISQQ